MCIRDREYTVTFNAYGGFPTPDEQHVKSGEKAVLPAEPTLKGHTFAFWYLGDDEENATAYDFDTPVTGDITVSYTHLYHSKAIIRPRQANRTAWKIDQ